MSLLVGVLVGCLFAQSGTTLQVTKDGTKIVVQGLTYEEVWSKVLEAVIVNYTIDTTDKTTGSISATKVPDWGDWFKEGAEHREQVMPKLTLIVQKNDNGTITILCRDSMGGGWAKRRFLKPFCKILGVSPKAVIEKS
jgi:hypothetical protein